MPSVPRCQTTASIDHSRGLCVAPFRPEEVQKPSHSEGVIAYIENPQGPLNLHLPQDGKYPGRPRVSLPEIVSTGGVFPGLQAGLDGMYGSDTTRYNRQRGLG